MRRIAAIVLFVTLVILSIDRAIVAFPFNNRAKMHALFTAHPDQQWYPAYPEYPAFLDEVRARTQRGDSIAIIVPTMHWDEGYSYFYYRASYFLSGREVLPVIARNDRVVTDNLKRAKYVAVWRRNVTDET